MRLGLKGMFRQKGMFSLPEYYGRSLITFLTHGPSRQALAVAFDRARGSSPRSNMSGAPGNCCQPTPARICRIEPVIPPRLGIPQRARHWTCNRLGAVCKDVED